MSSRIELDSEASLQQVPFIEGVEVWDNMFVGLPEDSIKLHEDYVAQKKQLTDDLFVQIGAEGRHKRGKGGLLMGVMELFLGDADLINFFARRGITLLVVTDPFVQAREAAKLDEAGLNGKPLIPPDLPRMSYTEAHARKISRFQAGLKDEVLPRAETKEGITEELRRRGIAVVVLTEGSVPLGYPQRRGDLTIIRGQDLGQSALYCDAFDKARSDNLWLYLIGDDEGLRNDEDSNRFREDFHFDGETRIEITIQGEKREASSLSKDLQEALRTVLRKSTASPDLILLDDSKLDALEHKLHKKGLTESADDMGYQKHLSGMIWLKSEGKPRRFKYLSNPRFPGRKTYHMDYLIRNSLVYRRFPRIYPELLPYRELLMAA